MTKPQHRPEYPQPNAERDQKLNLAVDINSGTIHVRSLVSSARVRSAATRKDTAVFLAGDNGTLNIRYRPCHSRSLIIVHLERLDIVDRRGRRTPAGNVQGSVRRSLEQTWNWRHKSSA
jgi:hypothetical protein